MSIPFTIAPLPIVPPGTPPYAWVTVPLHVVRETERALLVTRQQWVTNETAWLPKDRVDRMPPAKDSTHERIRLPVWLWARVRLQLLQEGEV